MLPHLVASSAKRPRPPARYSEATLIKELERLGIGRLSTYSAILDTILTRDYMRIEKRFLVPTSTGETVIEALNSRFSFVGDDFTRRLEDDLD